MPSTAAAALASVAPARTAFLIATPLSLLEGPQGSGRPDPDATWGEALDPIGQFVMDVAGGHHAAVTFWSGPILDAFEDSPPAFAENPAVALLGGLELAVSGLLGDSGSHSKAAVVRDNEDVFLPPLFQKLRGFSSSFPGFCPTLRKITLG
jgi:hypothetical protein